MVIVSDTSAINALLRVGEIDILQTLYGQVLIPVAVEKELRRSHAFVPDFIQTATCLNNPLMQKLCENLDAGEAQAIMLAVEHHADFLLIDEKKGRAVAKQAGLKYLGLAGVLIEAKRLGVIQNVGSLLSRITNEAGFRLSPLLIASVLAAAGEE